ncbi:hypothetical protein Tco_0133287 [Tanacetum coccineum]
MNKSKLMGVLVDDEKVKQAASKLGCLILKPPFSYLGSKVGGSIHRIQLWTEVSGSSVCCPYTKWKNEEAFNWRKVYQGDHGEDRKVGASEGLLSVFLDGHSAMNSLFLKNQVDVDAVECKAKDLLHVEVQDVTAHRIGVNTISEVDDVDEAGVNDT